ncbi:uncharacterized protein LOC116800959 isoform X2 [Drosophila sechellia]|uniref:uncharacterized protein LOC116800959 isoform X2 n=2 Tax=Drosophila sechellia TaxID=7238 RepID=UPI0013DDD16B|nr:uncharacterized protein LOC116800959 isoform X2 [Drosophila sechellia]
MNAWIPKYKYLGAGNKLHNGKPYNRTDAIAEQHDWAYERARTPNDIYKADAEAINQFSEEFQRSRTLGALAGEVGLSIKSTVDKLAGKPVYPDLPGTKCRPNQSLLYQNQLKDNGMEKSFGISIKIIKRDDKMKTWILWLIVATLMGLLAAETSVLLEIQKLYPQLSEEDVNKILNINHVNKRQVITPSEKKRWHEAHALNDEIEKRILQKDSRTASRVTNEGVVESLTSEINRWKDEVQHLRHLYFSQQSRTETMEKKIETIEIRLEAALRVTKRHHPASHKDFTEEVQREAITRREQSRQRQNPPQQQQSP